jgi:spermidine synthase
VPLAREDEMTRPFLRLLVIAFLASCLVPLITVDLTNLHFGIPFSSKQLILNVVVLAIVGIVTVIFRSLLKRSFPYLDANAREEVEFLDSISPRYLNLAIFGSAAVSLLLELAMIRWQGTVFEFFAFYKNFGLLACFAGLGLGYALASRDRVLLELAIPLLAWQFALMICLRYALPAWHTQSLRILPFHEELSVVSRVASAAQGAAIYFFLATIFLLTVMTFLPIGQLCGRLMQQRDNLGAYGWNLLGSLCGVFVMFVVSYLWTPPIVWFAVCMAALILFYRKGQTNLLSGLGWMLVAILILAWPVNPLWKMIYSPYQMIEVGYGERGLMLIRAAGHYYQRVHNLSDSNVTLNGDERLKRIRNYYDLPYHIYGRPNAVAIVGAGTGNDAAAALRAGASSVDAIEIDPAILMEGRANHPEAPYSDPRVRAVVNDARSFMRTTPRTYDMVVYGLLDSHTLLSSGVRLDSFVYTVEGLRESRSRLKQGGLLSLSFGVVSDELGHKIYEMMREAFDDHPPICVYTNYDGSVTFLQSKEGALTIPPRLLEQSGFEDKTIYFANPALHADVSTDDWPFFYMPRRVYPFSYLVMLGCILLISILVTTTFLPEKPVFSDSTFLFLGAGFMLIETKGITELGLTFGNTWHVIGIIICGILVMAFLANSVVQRFRIRGSLIPFILLLSSLALGWVIAKGGGFHSTPLGKLETVIVLTCPIFFSGMVFSTLLASRKGISAIMAVNLVGAMLGGLMEYNAMYFGFRSLYLLAMAFYLLALVTSRVPLFATGHQQEVQPEVEHV